MTDHEVTEHLHRVDLHFHVGLRGDRYPLWGGISDRMRKMWPTYDVFLLYAGIEKGNDRDDVLMQRTIDVVSRCLLDRVVCLALDHVYDRQGRPRKDLSDFWVANEYVMHLRDQIGSKALFGASVHPYDPNFETRVAKCVDDGAVLLKWLPSSQQFTLADTKVRAPLKFLATAKDGKPLPLLLHTGVEYAVPTTDERTRPYDFLSWGSWDRFWNFWRFGNRWYTPNIPEVLRTIDEGLDAGCVIILAHCGLPYFAAQWLRWLEHDDLRSFKKGAHPSRRRFRQTSVIIYGGSHRISQTAVRRKNLC